MCMRHTLRDTGPLCRRKHNAAVKRQVAVHNVKLLLCKQRFVITIAAPVGKLIVRLVQNTHTGGSDLRLHGTRFFISQTIGAVKFFCIQSLLQPHGHNIRAAVLQWLIYDQYFFLLVHCGGNPSHKYRQYRTKITYKLLGSMRFLRVFHFSRPAAKEE